MKKSDPRFSSATIAENVSLTCLVEGDLGN